MVLFVNYRWNLLESGMERKQITVMGSQLGPSLSLRGGERFLPTNQRIFGTIWDYPYIIEKERSWRWIELCSIILQYSLGKLHIIKYMPLSKMESMLLLHSSINKQLHYFSFDCSSFCLFIDSRKLFPLFSFSLVFFPLKILSCQLYRNLG